MIRALRCLSFLACHPFRVIRPALRGLVLEEAVVVSRASSLCVEQTTVSWSRLHKVIFFLLCLFDVDLWELVRIHALVVDVVEGAVQLLLVLESP